LLIILTQADLPGYPDFSAIGVGKYPFV